MSLTPYPCALSLAWRWQWLRCVALLGLSLMWLTSEALAVVPRMSTLQGTVTDLTTARPLPSTEPVLFRFYDVATPGGAIVLWQELHTITFLAGTYRVTLGADPLNPLFPDLFASGQIELGITIGTDEELQPRLRLNSV